MSNDVKYYCELCEWPCQPQLFADYIASNCCEAHLRVDNGRDRRRISQAEYEDLYAALTSDDDRSPHEKARLRSLDR